MLRDILADAGYEVVVANCGRDATAVLDDPSQRVAGLITDINMGGGPNGWEVARHARVRDPGLPVVYMTGAAAGEWAAHGVPCSILVDKPFVTGQLITVISTLLDAVDSDNNGLTETGLPLANGINNARHLLSAVA